MRDPFGSTVGTVIIDHHYFISSDYFLTRRNCGLERSFYSSLGVVSRDDNTDFQYCTVLFARSENDVYFYPMLFTVVLCTYNREDLLSLAIRSILENNYPRIGYKLLIVDNYGSSSVQALARGVGAEYVYEPQVGLSHARNRAAAEVGTEWILYLDDDMLASPDLLTHFSECILHPSYGAVGGNFTHWFRAEPPVWLDKYYSGTVSPSSKETWTILGQHEYLFGGIMGVRRAAVLAVGGFNPRLGMRGKLLGYAEENDIQDKLRNAGWKIGYDPRMTMRHLVQPYKYTIRHQFNEAFAQGRADAVRSSRGKLSRVKMIVMDSAITTFYSIPFNLLRLTLKRGYVWQHAVVDTGKNYAFTLGFVIFTIKSQP